MIIEDDHLQAQMLKKHFVAAKHKVKLLFDGRQAIDSLTSSLPDVIITDYYLPGHNAVEFVNELKSYPDTSSIPVILYSTHAANIGNLPQGVQLFDKAKVTPRELVAHATSI